MFTSKIVVRFVGSALEQQQQFILLAANGQHASRRFFTPMQVYEKKVEEKKLMPDKAQKNTAQQLEELYNTLKDYKPTPVKSAAQGGGGFFSKLLKKEKTGSSSIQLLNTSSPKGLYIYGSVGGGKTTLMDLFYDCCTNIDKKQRVHFNSFMSQVHGRIHQVKQERGPRDRAFNTEKPEPFDPTLPVAEMIAAESWLICFDEFQVTDIADAMILKSLFTHLFNEGIVCVATSNRHPTELYKNGLQRSNFLPFIDVLLNRSNLAAMDSGVDYRRIAQSGDTNYFVTTKGDAKSQMERMFKILCSQENDIIRPRTITHFGRDLTFQRTCGQVLDSDFEELCNRPLGGSDYIQIGQFFHTVLIHNVPQLTLQMKSQMRRFITLIDTLYDNRVRVVMSAEAPLDKLFNFSDKPTDIADDQRMLMDDLKLGAQDTSASVFTGEEEMFAYDRTISRLYEMQKKEYWEQWAKHR
ncbi:putative ATPase N2B [Lucilia cuprina]|uniref:putative ATPase N2B n=1 Tax=Lucilia cuprina TaxID=7375 RepID=UPI001F064B9E|nr:putative ATPase N2B [Lucilia cuprina]